VRAQYKITPIQLGSNIKASFIWGAFVNGNFPLSHILWQQYKEIAQAILSECYLKKRASRCAREQKKRLNGVSFHFATVVFQNGQFSTNKVRGAVHSRAHSGDSAHREMGDFLLFLSASKNSARSEKKRFSLSLRRDKKDIACVRV
jgi:hypothetical protein